MGHAGLIPGSGRSPGEGDINPLQYSCLGNPMDRGAWWVTVQGVTKIRTQLSDWARRHKHTHHWTWYSMKNIPKVGLLLSVESSLFLVSISEVRRAIKLAGQETAGHHGSRKMKCSHLVVSDSLQPMDYSPPVSLYPWNSLGKNTGVVFHFLL